MRPGDGGVRGRRQRQPGTQVPKKALRYWSAMEKEPCRGTMTLSMTRFMLLSPMMNWDRKKRTAQKLGPLNKATACEKATKARLGLSRNCGGAGGGEL